MFEGPVTGNIPRAAGPGSHAVRSSNGPGGKHCGVRQQRGRHPVPGRQSHRRAGLKAGQQRAGAGNCAPGHGGGPGHHGRAGGRARKQHRRAAELADHGPLQQGRPVGLRRAGGRGGDEEHPGRRGPEAVQLQHHGGHERFHRLGQQRHAGHGGRQLRPQDGGGPALPGHSGEDHAAGGGHQGGQRSPGAVTAAALASELASRDASISGLQASKADASALTAYALQSSVDTSSEVASWTPSPRQPPPSSARRTPAASLLSTVDGLDTPLEVDTKIANALLGLATEAFVAAQLASRDASITALQGAKADAALLASYATNAALSASETALQSALDAILAELAALQLSGSGVVNAPAWAGFTTWELLRGSSVVRNLHFVAPLSAALANGDDTLSITADCYSTAGTDAAITAALLAYYTSAPVDALLGDCRTGTAQDAETTSAITAALLAYYTSAQVDALLGDYRTASAQDTQTQAAIAGALLAYRTGPDQDVFTTNQITSALVAYRSAADQDTATASSIAAALLSYYTITQVDGLLANKLGVTEAASALQIAVRFPDDGGADKVVAASWAPRTSRSETGRSAPAAAAA